LSIAAKAHGLVKLDAAVPVNWPFVCSCNLSRRLTSR